MTSSTSSGARPPQPRPAVDLAPEDTPQSKPDGAASSQVSHLDEPGDEEGRKRPSVTQRLLAMTAADYAVFRSTEGRTYAERLDDPGWAMAHGHGGAFMADVKERFYLREGDWPTTNAAAAAADRAEGLAQRTPARPVSKRAAFDGRRVVIDLGDDERRLVVVTADGFTVTDTVPVGVIFERSSITGPIPTPAVRGDLDALWRLAPIAEPDRPLLLAALLMAWLAGQPCPVVYVRGPADAGKTTFTRFVLSLVDPVIVDRGGSLPTSEDTWKARLSGSRCVMIDNSSGFTAAGSVLLCVVATGGEASTRTLYTNAGLHVTNVLAPVWLTSIDLGALRGDLASRMVSIELLGLTEERRRLLSELQAEQVAATPAIVRALLDLLVQVLRRWPTVDRTRLGHRMTDYALVVRCLDELLGTDGQTRLAEQSGDLAADVLGSDVVARALLTGVERQVPETPRMSVLGTHTPRGLLEALTWWAEGLNNGRVPQGWPRTESVLSGHLKRLAPTLLAVEGITVRSHRSNGARLVTISQGGAA